MSETIDCPLCRRGRFCATNEALVCDLGCWKCLEGVTDRYGNPATGHHMILCPECGNKRCPKASDHTLACTNSNASGQPGSRY